MKIIARQKIRIYYYLAGAFAMVFMAVSLSAPYFLNMKKEHQFQVEQLAQSIISQKKHHLSDIVNRTILEIELSKKDVAKEYSVVCQELCSVLSTIHNFDIENATANSPTYFKDVGHKSPALALNNVVSFVVFDTKKSQVVFSSKDIAAKQFSETLLSSASDRELYPSFATGISVDGFSVYAFVSKDNVENIVKSRVKEIIRAVRLEDEGYIWINKIANYDGGDDYAIRLVHPNLPLTEGLKLSTKMEDAHGNLPYKTELEGVKKNGELYFEYYFKKINVDQVSHKLTYAKLYKPYDWVVATGVYLDDVDSLVLNEQAAMNTTYNSQLRMLGVIVLSIFTVSILALVGFEKQINTLISSYVGAIKESEGALRVEKDNLDKAFEQLKSVAYLDYLTNLWNRRAMYERIIEEASRCIRTESHFVVIIGDIDHFKNINDTYGHDNGDLVLKRLSEVISSNVRVEDSVSRWGGEEFLILGTSCDICEGTTLAEKLRSAVEITEILLNDHSVKVTMTFGVAAFGANRSIDETIKDADSLLYLGKKGSRNCVISPMSSILSA